MPPRRPSLPCRPLLGALTLLILGSHCAWGAPKAAAAPVSKPRWRVHFVGGDRLVGDLAQFAAGGFDFRPALQPGAVLRFDWKWLSRLERINRPQERKNRKKQPPSEDAPSFELGFKVSDVDAIFSELVDMGARPVMPPSDRGWGQRSAYLRDPDGYLIEVVQDLAG